MEEERLTFVRSIKAQEIPSEGIKVADHLLINEPFTIDKERENTSAGQG